MEKKRKFEKILIEYEPELEKICKALSNNHYKHKIEVEDLMQEARLKFWQLHTDPTFNINNRKLLKTTIRNRLLNYIRDETTTIVKGEKLLKPHLVATSTGLLEDYI